MLKSMLAVSWLAACTAEPEPEPQVETWTEGGCEFDAQGVVWDPELWAGELIKLPGCPIRLTHDLLPARGLWGFGYENSVVCQTTLPVDVVFTHRLDVLGFLEEDSPGHLLPNRTVPCVDIDTGEELRAGSAQYDGFPQSGGIVASGSWLMDTNGDPISVLLRSTSGTVSCGVEASFTPYLVLGEPIFTPEARRISCDGTPYE